MSLSTLPPKATPAAARPHDTAGQSGGSSPFDGLPACTGTCPITTPRKSGQPRVNPYLDPRPNRLGEPSKKAIDKKKADMSHQGLLAPRKLQPPEGPPDASWSAWTLSRLRDAAQLLPPLDFPGPAVAAAQELPDLSAADPQCMQETPLPEPKEAQEMRVCGADGIACEAGPSAAPAQDSFEQACETIGLSNDEIDSFEAIWKKAGIPRDASTAPLFSQKQILGQEKLVEARGWGEQSRAMVVMPGGEIKSFILTRYPKPSAVRKNHAVQAALTEVGINRDRPKPLARNLCAGAVAKMLGLPAAPMGTVLIDGEIHLAQEDVGSRTVKHLAQEDPDLGRHLTNMNFNYMPIRLQNEEQERAYYDANILAMLLGQVEVGTNDLMIHGDLIVSGNFDFAFGPARATVKQMQQPTRGGSYDGYPRLPVRHHLARFCEKLGGDTLEGLQALVKRYLSATEASAVIQRARSLLDHLKSSESLTFLQLQAKLPAGWKLRLAGSPAIPKDGSLAGIPIIVVDKGNGNSREVLAQLLDGQTHIVTANPALCHQAGISREYCTNLIPEMDQAWSSIEYFDALRDVLRFRVSLGTSLGPPLTAGDLQTFEVHANKAIEEMQSMSLPANLVDAFDKIHDRMDRARKEWEAVKQKPASESCVTTKRNDLIRAIKAWEISAQGIPPIFLLPKSIETALQGQLNELSCVVVS